MAEPASVADEVLMKLADQLECSICLESFTNPKMLQCFHVFCKNCLEPLVLQDQHGLSLDCPQCRRSTLLPASGVSGLQSAFHIHHLFEIQDALMKVKQAQEGKPQCEKCKEREASGFCRDCNKFVCEECMKVHQTWEELRTHNMITLEQLKKEAAEMVSLTSKTLYCAKHPEMKLVLFCETDQELICRDCIVKTHRDHQYDLVSEAFPKHRDIIASHLEPVKQQLSTVNKAIQGLDTNRDEITTQRAEIEADIQRKIRQLHEALEVRKTELIDQLDQMTQQKLKTLSIQRDELELIQTRLNSCLQFVSDSLKTGSEGEILAMEKPVMQQVKEMCAEFDTNKLLPQEQADMALIASSELLPACQQFGQIYSSQLCPEKCYATGKGLETATVGDQNAVTVHAIDRRGSNYAKPLPESSISCELVSCATAESVKCTVEPAAGGCKISFQPTHRGKHQLHIALLGQHIRDSPFILIALGKLNAPIRVVTGLRGPWGMTFNRRGEVIVSEWGGHCISIYNTNGEKVKLFGKEGSAPGQFRSPRGVAVDRAGNIVVADDQNHRIQKFTGGGSFVATVGGKGSRHCKFSYPGGIGISLSNKVYICDQGNHRVQILNPDLTFFSSFGSEGSGDGQFKHPYGVAFDSRGNVYVADGDNHRIQVFTKDGHFLRKVGKKGGGDGELGSPTGVAIDSDDVVYVSEGSNHRISLFTSGGHFLRSFGTSDTGMWGGVTVGAGPAVKLNTPHGVAVDKNGLVYVCDWGNDCWKVW